MEVLILFLICVSVVVITHIVCFLEMREKLKREDEISNEDLRLINKILKEKRIKYEIIRRD
jgi:hypothetical protein